MAKKKWFMVGYIDNDDENITYPIVSKNALNRFVSSLQTTLDNKIFHLFRDLWWQQILRKED